MTRLVIRTSAMILGCALWALPAIAQPYVYVASNEFAATPTGPGIGNVFRVHSGTSLDGLASISLGTGGTVTGLVLGPEDRRAYVAVGSSDPGVTGGLYVIDTLSVTIAKTITFPIGAAAAPWHPSGLAMSADRSRLYIASQAPNRITVLRTSDDTVLSEFVPAGAPGAMAVSPDGATLFVAIADSRSVSFIDLSSQQEVGSVSFARPPASLALSADGSRLFVGAYVGFFGGDAEIDSVDVPSRQVLKTVALQANPYSLYLSPDGGTLYAGTNVVTGGFGNFGQVEVYETAGLTRSKTIDTCGAYDIAAYVPTSRAYVVGSCGVHSVGVINVIDTATQTFVTSRSFSILSGARIAVGAPAGCTYELTPRVTAFGPGGGTGSLTMSAGAGCSWTINSPAAWLQFTPPSGAPASSIGGSGSGTINFTVASSAGEPRSAVLSAGFQHVVVKQTQPLAWIDDPASNTTVNQPFIVRGWAIDRDDDPADFALGTGVDDVHVWAYPDAGTAPIFLGRDRSGDRLDIAAVFGSKYRFAGFSVQVRGLAPGVYTIVAFAHSSRTGVFSPATARVTVRNDSNPAGVIDAPKADESLTQPFVVAGWAADLASPAGTGVDAVHVWAYPDTGGSPVFAGAAQYGQWQRPDAAGSLHTPALISSGYLLLVDGLAPGGYTLVAFAHSTVTGAFTPRIVHVNITASAQPIIHVDSVATGNGGAFFGPYVQLAGWAVDTRATSGAGVSAVHVWAYPTGGGTPIFLGAATTDRARDITALLFGEQFTNSGWNVSSALAVGTYRVVVFALSAVTGRFDNVSVVDVIVR